MVWSEKFEKQWLEMELNICRCFTNPENGKDNKSLLIIRVIILVLKETLLINFTLGKKQVEKSGRHHFNQNWSKLTPVLMSLFWQLYCGYVRECSSF